MLKSVLAANHGVPRNKKPLQNILYRIEAASDGGHVLCWACERDFRRDGVWSLHGPVTEAEIKERLTAGQWAKFRQGERRFVVQRRVDGRNVKKGASR